MIIESERKVPDAAPQPQIVEPPKPVTKLQAVRPLLFALPISISWPISLLFTTQHYGASAVTASSIFLVSSSTLCPRDFWVGRFRWAVIAGTITSAIGGLGGAGSAYLPNDAETARTACALALLASALAILCITGLKRCGFYNAPSGPTALLSAHDIAMLEAELVSSGVLRRGTAGSPEGQTNPMPASDERTQLQWALEESLNQFKPQGEVLHINIPDQSIRHDSPLGDR